MKVSTSSNKCCLPQNNFPPNFNHIDKINKTKIWPIPNILNNQKILNHPQYPQLIQNLRRNESNQFLTCQTLNNNCQGSAFSKSELKCKINKKLINSFAFNANQLPFINHIPNIPNNGLNIKFNKKLRVPFTKEEDEKIRILVQQYGPRSWQLISSCMPGRTPKQCRDRYANYLIPGFSKSEWSKDEDQLLRKLYYEIGPKWSIIQKSFPERSPTSIKNRWNYFLCRQETTDVNENNNNCNVSNHIFETDFVLDENDNKTEIEIFHLLNADDVNSIELQNNENDNIPEINQSKMIQPAELNDQNSIDNQEKEILDIIDNNNLNIFEYDWNII